VCTEQQQKIIEKFMISFIIGSYVGNPTQSVKMRKSERSLKNLSMSLILH